MNDDEKKNALRQMTTELIVYAVGMGVTREILVEHFASLAMGIMDDPDFVEDLKEVILRVTARREPAPSRPAAPRSPYLVDILLETEDGEVPIAVINLRAEKDPEAN